MPMYNPKQKRKSKIVIGEQYMINSKAFIKEFNKDIDFSKPYEAVSVQPRKFRKFGNIELEMATVKQGNEVLVVPSYLLEKC